MINSFSNLFDTIVCYLVYSSGGIYFTVKNGGLSFQSFKASSSGKLASQDQQSYFFGSKISRSVYSPSFWRKKWGPEFKLGPYGLPAWLLSLHFVRLLLSNRLFKFLLSSDQKRRQLFLVGHVSWSGEFPGLSGYSRWRYKSYTSSGRACLSSYGRRRPLGLGTLNCCSRSRTTLFFRTVSILIYLGFWKNLNSFDSK